MKKIIPSDVMATFYFIAISLFLFLETKEFIELTKNYPLWMGFAKFALLGTFGECLKYRIGNKKWIPKMILPRFVIWGVFGFWITLIFPFVDGGVVALQGKNLWPTFFSAFWKSAWVNFLSGYAFFMMLSHFWVDSMLEKKTFCGPWEIFNSEKTKKWAKKIVLSLFWFWIPMHTITFLLPPEWRIIFAAYLSICLGFIISLSAKKNS